MSDALVEFWKRTPEDPFDVLFDHTPVMMHSIDDDGIILKVSQHWARKLGFEREGMIGRKSVDFLTDASRKFAVEVALPKFKKSGTAQDVPYDFVLKDGQVLPVLMSATSQFDRDGNFVRSLAIISDNQEVSQARAMAEQKEREAQLANAARLQFLAAMSHEIRTPMNAILGFAQLLRWARLDRRSADQVEAIVQAGNSLIAYMDDLLDLSEIEAGRMRIARDSFDVVDMVAKVQDAWQPTAESKGLDLHVVRDPDLPRAVSADAARIRQVLNNLLRTAIKTTLRGNVMLRAKLASRTGQDAILSFCVHGGGVGIEPGRLDRVLHPAGDVDADAVMQNGGMGLALSVSSRLAILMGGRLTAKTHSAEGATFSFEVPVTIDEPGFRQRGALGAQPRALRVLAAEENTLNRDLLRRVLAEFGHDLTLVGDGEEAVAAAARHRFDLILMDLEMPRLNGIEAARRIIELAGDARQCPIVALTAHVTPEMRARCMDVGMAAFLAKPIRLDDLRALLDATAGSLNEPTAGSNGSP